MALDLTVKQLGNLKKITEGGEATIYNYASGREVLKVFKPHVDLAVKQQKVKRLTGANLPSTVVVPREEVLVSGRFIGYTMSNIKGAEVVHQLTKNKVLKATGATNLDALKVVVSIGQTLGVLGRGGVVIGDISDQNVLYQGHDVYFIDVDSWGIGRLPPDTYTEVFTAPECYERSGVKMTHQSDQFAFAVLAFNILARIHPFNGTLERDSNMSTIERIKRGMSVLGKEKIVIPKMVPSWQWMSGDLIDGLRNIFEAGQRNDITPLLEDQLANSKYCAKHGLYYYGRYADCPLCSGKATLIAAPVAVKVAIGSGPVIKVLFEAEDLAVLFNENCYLTTSGEIVHIATGRRVKFVRGQQVNFTANGQFALVADADMVEIYDINDQLTGRIERVHGTYAQVKGNSLYMIDTAGNLLEVRITAQGNMKRIITPTYQPLFSVADDGEIFVFNRYRDKGLVSCNGRNFELEYSGKIVEYAIRRDEATGKWLLVYQLPNGKFRTVIFGHQSIEYDSDVLQFHASPLSGICFFGGTIYDPAGGKIIGTNVFKHAAKEFDCGAVDESSKLQFSNGGFTITTDDKIYRFG